MFDESNPAPQDFRNRHGLKVLGVLMVAMFSLVIVAQVGC